MSIWYLLKKSTIFDVRGESERKNTNCAIITSFLWSVPLLNIGLHQSARLKSFSYCKSLFEPLWPLPWSNSTQLFVPSLVPKPVHAIRVTRGGLEPSAIVLSKFSWQAWQVTSHPKSPRTTRNEAGSYQELETGRQPLYQAYRVPQNFCVWFFLLGINFCDFQEVPSSQHWLDIHFYWVRVIELHTVFSSNISLFLNKRDKLWFNRHDFIVLYFCVANLSWRIFSLELSLEKSQKSQKLEPAKISCHTLSLGVFTESYLLDTF